MYNGILLSKRKEWNCAICRDVDGPRRLDISKTLYWTPTSKFYEGWMASWTRWLWLWVHSRRWWWTRRPGVLQFMGSQRVGHDWATELKWTELNCRMWALDYKESWVLKNWYFWTVVLEKTLESPLDSKEIKTSQSKGKSTLNIH